MSAPRLRILLLTQYFWPESFSINAFVPALQRSGADVTVLTGQPNYPDGRVFPGYRALSIQEERFGTARVWRVPIAPRGSASGVRLATNYVAFVASASLFGPLLLRGQQFDVVLVYAPSPLTQAIPAIALRRLKHAKVVTWVQDLWPQSLESTGHVRNPLLLRLAEQMVRWIYRHNDLLLGQSRRFAEALRGLAGRTPVEYFPNPGDDPTETPSAAVVPPLHLDAGFTMVFAGNIGTVQGLETLLGAAAILRQHSAARFVIVGSGSRAAWLAEQVRQRELKNVVLAGRFARDAMPAIFAQADSLLVTLNRGEILGQTIPSKVQAYLAAGRPILGSLDGEGADLLKESGAGLVSPAEDAPALAENVLRMMRLDPREREGMGAAGRRYYEEHFHPDVLARRLVERLRALVETGAGLAMPQSVPQ